MGGVERGGDAFAVGEEGEVGDDEFIGGAAGDGAGVEGHHVDGGGEGVGVAVDDHGDGIADEDAVDGGLGDETREGVVVAGDHGEPATGALGAQKIDGSDGGGHGRGTCRGGSGPGLLSRPGGVGL